MWPYAELYMKVYKWLDIVGNIVRNFTNLFIQVNVPHCIVSQVLSAYLMEGRHCYITNIKITNYHIICKICHLNLTQKPMNMQHIYNITYTNLRLTMFMQNIVYTLMYARLQIVLQKLSWIKLIHSLQGFTRYIKDYILQSYQEICTVVNCYICGVPV